MKIALLWAARRPLQFLFKEIVDIRVQAGVFSDIRYEIRDGMLNISFFFFTQAKINGYRYIATYLETLY